MNIPDMSGTAFAPAIRQAATEAGRAPSIAQVAELEAQAQTLGRYDALAGRVMIEQNGQAVPFYAWLADELLKVPRTPETIAPESIPEAKSSEPDWCRGRQDPFAKMVRAGAIEDDEKYAALCATWPNPFLKENWSRTNQSIMMNKNPALAMKHKAEAGL